MAIISQREAKRLQKRVRELEAQEERRRCVWSSDWPGGVNIATLDPSGDLKARIEVARKLFHAVVVTQDGGLLRFYALPIASGRE